MKTTGRLLTRDAAGEFLHSLNAIRDPRSLSYNDNYAGAAISRMVQDYGFKDASVMEKACKELLHPTKAKKASKPAQVAKKRELTYGVARTYVDNYKGINDPNSMSYCDGHAISWLEDQAKKYGYGDRISTMNAACRIFLRNNKPAKKGAKLRIEIVKYMGKWGAFASGESEMYRAELVGANGKRQGLPDTRACCTGYDGHPERKYPEQVAKQWAALLGCQIVSVDKTSKKVAA